MSVMKFTPSLIAIVSLSVVSLAARAQMAVIDVGAIAQLIAQANTLEQELNTARQDLSQAQQQYQSMTGQRGMQQLLAGTVRNYLPTNWTQLQAALQGSSGGYALGADVRGAVTGNAVLSPQQVASLSPDEQDSLQEARRNAALLQAVAQEALMRTSNRFAAIQVLIDAIPQATDEKGILDLAARIDAEEGMLQNEQTKLNVFGQAAQGGEWVRRQRARERAITDIGSLRSLPAMGL
jgi:type IV secretion system protein VirB5